MHIELPDFPDKPEIQRLQLLSDNICTFDYGKEKNEMTVCSENGEYHVLSSDDFVKLTRDVSDFLRAEYFVLVERMLILQERQNTVSHNLAEAHKRMRLT